MNYGEITDETPVLVGQRGTYPQIYGFFTVEEVEAARAVADTYYSTPTRLMTFGEYLVVEKAHWADLLNAPPTEIDAEKFDYALNVLPPANFSVSHDFTTFTMIERTSGSMTEQYAAIRIGGQTRYFSKLVDLADRKTWMKYSELLGVPS